MFYCPLHNWYSSEEPCKACHPMQTTTLATMVINTEGSCETHPHPNDIKKEEQPFQWNDELVKEFANELHLDVIAGDADIKDFKKSKQQTTETKAGTGTPNDVGNEMKFEYFDGRSGETKESDTPISATIQLSKDSYNKSKPDVGNEKPKQVFGVNLEWKILVAPRDLEDVMKASECKFIGTEEECREFIKKYQPEIIEVLSIEYLHDVGDGGAMFGFITNKVFSSENNKAIKRAIEAVLNNDENIESRVRKQEFNIYQAQLRDAEIDAFHAGRERIGGFWNDQIKNWKYETPLQYLNSINK